MLVPESSASEGQTSDEKIRQQLLQDTGDTRLPAVTLSASVASLRSGETRQAWLSRADAALYAATAGGRHQTVLG